MASYVTFVLVCVTICHIKNGMLEEQKPVLNVLGSCTRLLSKSTSEKCACLKQESTEAEARADHDATEPLRVEQNYGSHRPTGCAIPTALIGPVLY